MIDPFALKLKISNDKKVIKKVLRKYFSSRQKKFLRISFSICHDQHKEVECLVKLLNVHQVLIVVNMYNIICHKKRIFSSTSVMKCVIF